MTSVDEWDCLFEVRVSQVPCYVHAAPGYSLLCVNVCVCVCVLSGNSFRRPVSEGHVFVLFTLSYSHHKTRAAVLLVCHRDARGQRT